MAVNDDALLLGLDFGTDSCRALVVAASDGSVCGEGVAAYRRWATGAGCDEAAARFRQHPDDHREALQAAIAAALTPTTRARIAGIGVASTASSPLALAADASPLADDPAFADDPDAWIWLWKDHTALAEAEALAAHWREQGETGGHDCTRHTGGTCSPEWYWPKRWCLLRRNPRVATAAEAVVEHADWIPALLGGSEDPLAITRNRCCAGHKAQWHPAWGGPPPSDDLADLDPDLAAVVAAHPRATVTHDHAVAALSAAWAERLELPPGIPIAAGLIDAHGGAIGAHARAGQLIKVVGTSNCDLLLAEPARLGQQVVPGISGQVGDAVLPGLVCLEAGQAAFGDALAWFAELLRWPAVAGLPGAAAPERGALIAALVDAAAGSAWGADGITALDWLNGRRSPDPDPTASAAFVGLRLGTTAPQLFRALLEALLCGTRAIHERFADHGLAITEVVALGGIAHRSPRIMQLMADMVGVPIIVAGSHQAVALGAAMNAACAAGLHRDLAAAQAAMTPPSAAGYRPDASHAAAIAACYARYRAMAGSR